MTDFTAEEWAKVRAALNREGKQASCGHLTLNCTKHQVPMVATMTEETLCAVCEKARAEDAFQRGYEAGEAVQHNACLVEETAKARAEGRSEGFDLAAKVAAQVREEARAEGERAGREAERADAMADLRKWGLANAADRIERGDHLRREP